MRTKLVLLFAFTFFTISGILAQVNLRPGSIPRTHFTKPVNKTVSVLNNGTLIVDTLQSLSDFVSTLFGPGISVSNLTYSGPAISIGHFYDTTGTLGIDTGILMTNGSVFNAPGPNNSPSTSTNNNLPGDPDLATLIPGYTTYDASVIEFDFTPQTDTLIAAKIVFGSEEYPEWVGSQYNDVFGFFGSGQGLTGNENIAVVGPNNSNICINSINDSLNSQFYIDNLGGTSLQYDGYTTVFTLMHTIVPGTPYHFKIAIADAGDHIYDAGVFMKANSFLGYAALPRPGFNPEINGKMVYFENTTPWARQYSWDFGDGSPLSTGKNPVHTYAVDGIYHVTLQAINYYQVASCSKDVTIGNAGIASYSREPAISIETLGRGLFHLSVKEAGNKGISIDVLNLTGQKIQTLDFQGNTVDENIDLRTLPSGLYILRMDTQNGIYTRKVIR